MNNDADKQRVGASNLPRYAGAAASVVLLGALGVLGWQVVRGVLSPAQAGQMEAEFSAEGKTVDAILNAANQYRTGGEIRKAETVLLAGEKQYPTEVLLNIAAAELMLYDKQLDKAYTHYQKAIVNDPKNAAVLFSAGTVASQLGRTEEAIGHYEAARANDPRDFRFPLFLAQVQVKLERYDEAKKNLLLAVTLNPESAVGWGTLAEIALREGNTGLSLQHIAKSRTIEPDVTLWRLIQARALKRQADPEGALALLIGLSPAQQREPGVLDTMEECLGLLGRIEDAADLFARATEHDVNDGAVALKAALWAERAKRSNDAFRYAIRAANLGTPGGKELVDRLSGGNKAGPAAP